MHNITIKQDRIHEPMNQSKLRQHSDKNALTQNHILRL